MVQLVQAHLALQLRRPAAERNWTEFRRALKAARTQAADRWELVFAGVDYLLASEPAAPSAGKTVSAGAPASANRKRAADLLRTAEDQFSKQAAFWRICCSSPTKDSARQTKCARVLARYSALEPSAVERAKLQVSLLANEGKFKEADDVLVGILPSLSSAERKILEPLRVTALMSANDLSAAQKLVGELIAAAPTDASLLAMGIEVSLETGDLATAEKWEAALGKITPNGAQWRYLRARRLLASYDQLKPAAKQELASLIGEFAWRTSPLVSSR